MGCGNSSDRDRTKSIGICDTESHPMAAILKIVAIFKFMKVNTCLFSTVLEELLVVVNMLWMKSSKMNEEGSPI